MFPPQGIGVGVGVSIGAKRSNTVIVAAHDSIDKSGADYVCDGIDDQETINSAISAISSTGGTVLLLEGTYIITDSINLASNIALVGQGRGTVLKLAPDLQGEFIAILGSEVSGVVVKNLKIDGISAEPNAFVWGVYLYKVTNSEVSDCWMEGGDMWAIVGICLNTCNNNIIKGNIFCKNAYGVLLYSSKYNTIADNVFWTGSRGVYLYYSENNTVIGNACQELAEAIRLERSNNNTVVGNAFRDCEICTYLLRSENNDIVGNVCQAGGYGVSLYSSSNNIIATNTIQGTNTSIYIDNNSNNNTITSNMLRENVFGIRLSRSSHHNIVIGNSLLNNGDGILLESACSYSLITSNIVRSQTNNGIKIASSDCENNVVHGNDLYQNGTDFYDGGTGTIYHNNRTTQGWVP
jgi:parallel beta-helix repeat protein